MWVFEKRSHHLQKMFKFKPKKCNSGSPFSDCVHRDKSKCLIVLPTYAKQVKLFEKTLISGCSYVNTQLAFDSQILLPKYEKNKYKLIYDVKKKKKSNNKNIKNG